MNRNVRTRYPVKIAVTVHGFKGSPDTGQAGFRGLTNKNNGESHQRRETCERMKKTTLNVEP